ncbi:MAG: serine dehydratase subunit alpha family protein [Alistipes sp.]|jgi:L-cysteine desulfidase|nr:serine dehydratase subunit alpha family protein [Alistipes sp.]MBO5972691.1 serine dehydratase subunit alpha family protein [Alistipes sp.]MBO7243180.1 serine dehydratase subunit alpha family protein [Alistipes sp.]
MNYTFTAEERKEIIALMNREIIPAIGCTEPIAVALCVAKATETLGCRPERIEARLSANVLKNAMGVGIPGTGMTGLPIAMALGAIVGKSEYELEVLKDADANAVEEGKKMIDAKCIDVDLKYNISEKLYIEIEVFAGGASAMAIISGGHTRFIHVSRCGEVLFSAEATSSQESAAPTAEVKDPELTLKRVWDFAMTAPVEELRFILEAKRLNMNAAYESLKGEYGHAIGKLFRSESERNVMGDTLHCQIVGMTTAACDARMAGAMIPVMSNSGSGNQGLTSTVPVAVYAEQIGANEEQTIRSLILSNLTVIYIKQSLGRLSALCGCVVAATGSSCGITYLMGGGYQEVTYAVKNMIANLAGMICDGAKPSCAMKCASGVSTAVVSALMAMNNRCVKSVEGIIDDDVDKSIRNLTDIGRDAMVHTDAMILRIMTSK